MESPSDIKQALRPSRRAFNPMLSDESVIGDGTATTAVFYTPTAEAVARHVELIIAGGAGLALLSAWVISLSGGPEPLRNAFVLLAFAAAGVPALPDVWQKLRKLSIDIDLLMLLGAGLAAYIGSPFEGALLLFLFALSGAMESFALRRTQSAITALRDLAPTEATQIDGGELRRVPLRRVAVGAMILVRPGEKIPLDGAIRAGRSSIDEAAITGESIPRSCDVGDDVFAGTQNIDGRLEVEVTKLATDTTLARIVKLVTDARHHPARAQRLIDRIGPAYSVTVILASLAVAVLGSTTFGLETTDAIHRGIALLIVGSPCALIIATPVAYLSAIGAAARRGVLIKGGGHLETIAGARVVAFDKTGTLTTGRLRLTDIEIDGLAEDKALRLVGALEASSTHPLARAVMDEVNRRGLTPPGVEHSEATPGEGEAGTVEGHRVWIGRPERLLRFAPKDRMEASLNGAEALRREGKTVSAVVIDDVVGLVAFQDTIRDDGASCIRHLRRRGVERIEMLTGDHDIIARRVASELSLDAWHAELTPEGKLETIARLRKEHGALVVVGDGINDAPALADADVGVAMGGVGSDIALDAADVVIAKDRIERVAWLFDHARRTASIVRQNLGLAIAVIGVLSVFAVTGRIELPIAVIGHEGSTVLVALNALRLLNTSRR